METYRIKSFLSYYGRLRERTLNLIAVIPKEHIDWAYLPGKFTIADQIRHLGAIERHVYAEAILGMPSKYRGCGKELADGFEDVLQFFNKMHLESLEIFCQLKDVDMDQKILSPGGFPISVGTWLRTLTEHEIHHRAQLYIYLNMLQVVTPPMFGLSSEDLIIMSNKQ